MKQTKIRIVANLKLNGKMHQIVEERFADIDSQLPKRECERINSEIKTIFEDALCRKVVVKSRIRQNEILVKVEIRTYSEDGV